MMRYNAYFTKDVASNLDIKTSTLRKYCLLLENAGYKFERNEKDQRIFYDEDLVTLRRLKEYTTEKGMKLDEAVKEVVARAEKATEMLEDKSVSKEVPDIARYNAFENRQDQLLVYIQKQDEYIKKQDERIEVMEHFIREVITRFDQRDEQWMRENQELKVEIKKLHEKTDQRFMETLRQVQEEKQAMLELAASKEEKPKRKWWQFGKSP
jgi:DNA-binding transcriptional MerR regulator